MGKHIKLKFCLLFTIICITGLYAQIVVYMSPNGSDQGQGTYGKPFKTFEKSISYLSSIKTKKNQLTTQQFQIILKGGTYYVDHPLQITNQNWIGYNNLIIEGDKDDLPIIKGSVHLQAFKKISDKLWKMNLSNLLKEKDVDVQQIFVNGERAIRARTPNDGDYFKTLKVEELPKNDKKSIQKISLSDDQFSALKGISAEDLKNVIISFNLKWDRVRGYLDTEDPDNKNISLTTTTMPSWLRLKDAPSIFFFENSSKFLDQPGEWFIDKKGILYYIPRPGERIESSYIEIPILDELLRIDGSASKKIKNIVFRNISFSQTKHTMPKEGEMPDQASSTTQAAITVNYAENIIFDHCEISQTGNNALWLKTGCSNCEITHCDFNDLGIGGIKIGNTITPSNQNEITKNNVVDNNIIHSGGYEIPTGVGVIIFHSGNNTVSHNDIADFRYSGISVGWIWGYQNSIAKNNKIINNHIHHLGWGELSDMGGVYTLGPSEGTEVSNNVIHDVYSYDYGGWGLYTDEGSTGIRMENNLVYNCKSSAFHQHYGKENIIRNNIFANNIKAQLEATRKEDHLSFTFTHNIIFYNRGVLIGKPGWDVINIQSDSNLYWDSRTKDIKFLNYSFDSWKKVTGKDIHSIIADPFFTDPDKENYTFKNTKNITRIGFKPFNYTRAGVYGDDKWLKKAKLEGSIINEFNSKINQRILEERIGK